MSTYFRTRHSIKQKSHLIKGGFEVELQGIEPWSREDERVRSTCLVDFNCRE